VQENGVDGAQCRPDSGRGFVVPPGRLSLNSLCFHS